MQKKISNHWLEQVHYAVFGLGDSAYQKYNVKFKNISEIITTLECLGSLFFELASLLIILCVLKRFTVSFNMEMDTDTDSYACIHMECWVVDFLICTEM